MFAVTVFDASALLAFLQGEAGCDVVESKLASDDSHCSAANWSEVAQKVRASGRDWRTSRALLVGYGIEVASVTADDAEAAAAMWQRGDALSLADRLCLALGHRLTAEVCTADAAWGGRTGVTVIR